MRTRKVTCGLAAGEGIVGVDDGVPGVASATGGTVASAALTATSAEFSLFCFAVEAESSAGFGIGASAVELAELSCFGGTTDDAGLDILLFAGSTGADGAVFAGAAVDVGPCAAEGCLEKTECIAAQTSSV